MCFVSRSSRLVILTGETRPEMPNDTGTKQKNGVEASMEDPICITLEYYRLVCQALSQLE